MAERAGVSVRAVSDLERGLYLVPHRDTVARLAEALGLGQPEAALLERTIIRQRGPAAGPAPRTVPEVDLTEPEHALPHDFEYRAPRPESPFDQHHATVLHALMDGRLILFLGDAINLVGRTPGDVWQPGTGANPPATTELARHLADLFHYPIEAPRDLSRVAQYVLRSWAPDRSTRSCTVY